MRQDADARAVEAADRGLRHHLGGGALRDHLADCGTTLPALVDADAPARLHFWFSGYEGHREALFPRLPRAYAAWRDGDGGRALRLAAAAGRTARAVAMRDSDQDLTSVILVRADSAVREPGQLAGATVANGRIKGQQLVGGNGAHAKLNYDGEHKLSGDETKGGIAASINCIASGPE